MAVSILFLFGTGHISFAQRIAPGILTEVHKELRGVMSCLKCHTLTGGINSAACKSCHVEWQNKIKENKGLHVRVKSDCVTCHTDHKGESYNITLIDEKSFAHSLTGYELKDSHVIKCNNCHNKLNSYLRISSKCQDCHTAVHKKTAPEDCIQCHNYKEWKDHTFDHFKNAEFKLMGKHIEVKCELCHTRETVLAKAGYKEKDYQVLKFKPLKSETCSDCHFDVHNEQFKDQKCDSCHSVEKVWKDKTFSHETEKYKGFKLKGKHKEVECEKCHIRSELSYTEFNIQKKVEIGLLKPLKSETCSDCHFDVHNEQFKDQKCHTCHSVEKDWKDKTFSHETEEYKGYKLEGKHKEVECEKCHIRSELSYTEFDIQKKIEVGLFKPLKSELCGDCHKNGHEGKFIAINELKEMSCTDCHSVEKTFKEHVYTHKKDSKYFKYNRDGQVKESDCAACHFCDQNLFSISTCFEQMGLMPSR